MENQPVKPVEPQRAPVSVKEKIKSRPAVVVLSLLLMIALTGIGTVTYAWIQERQKTADAQSQLQATRKTLEDFNKLNIGSAEADQQAEKIPHFGAFLGQYNNFLANSVIVDKDKEKAGIEAAIKSYYKTSSLPDGWAVLSIYQVVKPETPPTGDYYALVYWPEGAKSAGFMPLYKPNGGEWRYDEQR